MTRDPNDEAREAQDTRRAQEAREAELYAKVDAYLPRLGNCAQTSYLALQEVFGLEGGPILEALQAFPGIALRGETCGAVTGSLLALGLAYGSDPSVEAGPGQPVPALAPARRFCRGFEAACGSTQCGDIVERLAGRRFDLADPEQVREWLESGTAARCRETVRAAVRIAGPLVREAVQS